ncbi:MAG: DNA polymerase III subunit delta [Patescibacteria group bacterium]|nr:DNA polymerase III subunit delta [Patescibacteria group bacterium]
MIKLYYGDNTFGIKQKISEDLAVWRSNNVVVDVRDSSNSWDELYIALNTQDLLTNTNRAVLVRDIFNSKGSVLKDNLFDWLKDNQATESLDVIFIENGLKASDLKTILKAKPDIVVEEFKEITIRDVVSWIEQTAKDQGYKLTNGVSSFLSQSFGNDLWRISSELKKANDYTNGNAITPNVIKELISPTLDDTIFQFIDALGARNIVAANKLLNRQLHMGTTEPEIVNIISYQFRNILNLRMLDEENVSPSSWASKTKLHPYVIKKTTPLSRKFSKNQLRKIFNFIHKTDLAYKTGKAPSKNSLDVLVAQIVSC